MAAVLDWGDRRHWAHRDAPCCYCQGRTHLRDDDGRPAHKICAEAATDTTTPTAVPTSAGAGTALVLTGSPPVTVTLTPDDNPLKAAALTLAARGCHVFPLLPGAKRPAVKGWEQRATTDPDRIARCWDHAPYNIGVATGPSGLVVVDLDVPKHDGDTPPEEWTTPGVSDGADVLASLAETHEQPYPGDTFTVRTPSGGTHLYFLAPDGEALRNTAGTLGWKIDTRAHGGYVVAPGSIIDGRPYDIIVNYAVAKLPTWLHRLLTPPQTAPAGPVSLPTLRDASVYATAALRGETDNVANAAEGARNATLVRAARALGRFIASGDLSRSVVEDALKAGAAACGLTEREAFPAITSALNWSIAHNGTHPTRRTA